MTAIASLRYDKGVIVGADTLKSSSGIVVAYENKLYQDKDLLLGQCGDIPPNFSYGQWLVPIPGTPQELFNARLNIVNAHKTFYQSNRIHVIVISAAPARDSFAVEESQAYSYWFIQLGYRPQFQPPKQNMTRDQAIKFVRDYLDAARSQSPLTVNWNAGGPQILDCPENGPIANA